MEPKFGKGGFPTYVTVSPVVGTTEVAPTFGLMKRVRCTPFDIVKSRYAA